MKKAELKDNRWWVGSNSWDANLYTQDKAEEIAKTLIGCENCFNCSYCRYCSSCSDCSDCRYCSSCSDCRYCSYCSDCSDCRYCSSCRYCSYCRYCSSCRYCSDFKSNPQRIVSPILGSRKESTTYYWNDEKEQIICGCFKGTMQEFKDKVFKTHRDNEFAKAYYKWIASVENYIKSLK